MQVLLSTAAVPINFMKNFLSLSSIEGRVTKLELSVEKIVETNQETSKELVRLATLVEANQDNFKQLLVRLDQRDKQVDKKFADLKEDLKEDIGGLRAEVKEDLKKVDQKVEKLDQKIEKVDQKVERIGERTSGIEQKVVKLETLVGCIHSSSKAERRP